MEYLTFRGRFESHGYYPLLNPAISDFSERSPPSGEAVTYAATEDRTAFRFRTLGGSGEALIDLSAHFGRENAFLFEAERFAFSRSSTGTGRQLAPNASNLPEVIQNLNSNRTLLDQLRDYVRAVLPKVRDVVSVLISPSQLELRCWAADPATKREDLCFPLSEWGTGVGQVIAILYVALTHETPSCIVIDEPNSFLHPGAAKKLIEILAQHRQHQYIISTHSPEIIRAANPEQIIHLSPTDDEPKISVFPSSRIDQLKGVLGEIGVSLSDVFGADAVLWVEGQTEEECYPLLIVELLGKPLLGFVVKHAHSVSALTKAERRKIRQFVRLYRQVSEGSAIIPSAVAFAFDPVSLTEKERADLEREFRGSLFFLPRRNYESYLIHPDAIAALLNSSETFKTKPEKITPEQIINWLTSHGGETKYHPDSEKPGSYGNHTWVTSVDGAAVLSDMFQSLSKAMEQYRKIPNSVQLTEWIIRNDPSHFNELKDFLTRVV